MPEDSASQPLHSVLFQNLCGVIPVSDILVRVFVHSFSAKKKWFCRSHMLSVRKYLWATRRNGPKFRAHVWSFQINTMILIIILYQPQHLAALSIFVTTYFQSS
jgi:hypothetical protein